MRQLGHSLFGGLEEEPASREPASFWSGPAAAPAWTPPAGASAAAGSLYSGLYDDEGVGSLGLALEPSAAPRRARKPKKRSRGVGTLGLELEGSPARGVGSLGLDLE